MSIEAMKQALEALENIMLERDLDSATTIARNARYGLRQAIAEAEKQEPMACQHKRYSIDVTEQIGTCIDCGSEGRMRFVVDDTHPQPKREWVELTNDEIEQLNLTAATKSDVQDIQAKLKDKNTCALKQ